MQGTGGTNGGRVTGRRCVSPSDRSTVGFIVLYCTSKTDRAHVVWWDTYGTIQSEGWLPSLVGLARFILR